MFRTGLLSGADAGDIGFHQATLGETIGKPAERALRDAGVEVRLGWRAERLARTANGVEVHGRGARGDAGEALEGLSAEATVLAVPHARAATLLEPLLGESARALRGLRSSPIVNLHVVYDRPVCEEPFAAGVGTPVQYVFDRTRAAGAPAGCQYLAVSLSGAEREMGMSVDATARALPARAARAAPARARGQGRALPGHARARRHLPRRPRRRRAASRSADGGSRARAGGRLDGHRLAGDARGRGPERARGRRGARLRQWASARTGRMSRRRRRRGRGAAAGPEAAAR